MQKEFKNIRLWKLLSYAAAFALAFSAYIGFLAKVPPNREHLGDYAFKLAWIRIILTGAAVGCITYLMTYLFARKSN